MKEQAKSPQTHQTILSQALQIGSRTQPFSQESYQKAPRIRDKSYTASATIAQDAAINTSPSHPKRSSNLKSNTN